jgi:hypothetical protein
MSVETGRFARMVVGLGQAAPPPSALRFAVEFARLMRLDLFGLFVSDPKLASLAGFPLLREFRTLERRWRATAGSGISSDLDIAVAAARRTVDEACRIAGVANRFEVVQATAFDAVASRSNAADIILAAAGRAAESGDFASLERRVAAALGTEAAVLIMPDRIARGRGPVAAVETAEGEATMAVARAVATATGERLETVRLTGRSLSSPWGPAERLAERLIVLPRMKGDSTTGVTLAIRRKVPVLIARADMA